MLAEPILAEIIAGIRRTLSADPDRTVIERAAIGLLLTGAKLNTSVAREYATPVRSIPEVLARRASTYASCAA